MLAFIPAVVLAALAPAVSALTITSPTSAGVTGNTTIQITWTYNQDDVPFSIELGNPSIQSGLLRQGPIAIGNNIVPNTQQLSVQLPVVPPGQNYFIAFVAIDNVNNVYANSSSFPISSNPTSSSVPLTTHSSTAPGTRTTSSHPATATNGTTSFTSLAITPLSPSGTGSVSSTSTSSFTSLVISTLSSSTTGAAPTSSSGAATRVEAAWYAGLVTAFLGAILA